MRCDSLILKTFALACLASACAGEGRIDSSRRSDLSTQVWQTMLDFERTSSYRETLSPELLQKHRDGIGFITDKIPYGYPEPYLPYGALADRTLDPGLTREPRLTTETVALGESLFFDKTLSYSEAHGFSATEGISCGSCHVEAKEFTDARPLSLGIEGAPTLRNTPTLWNSAYYSTLTWSNPHFPILEMQAKIPLFNDDPIEMGLRGKELQLMRNLANSPHYQELIRKAYGLDLVAGVEANTANYTIVTSALAAYERTLIHFRSSFDLYLQGLKRLSREEMLGAELFYGLRTLRSGDTLGCARCHGGFLMTDSFHYVRDGIYFSRKVMHKEIRTPGLRFVKDTAPYLHDGSLDSLEAVLDLYQSGDRDSALQPAFLPTDGERDALLAFLRSL